jgi:acyl carrier protein
MTNREEVRQALVRVLDRAFDASNRPALLKEISQPNGNLDFSSLDIDSLSAAEMCLYIEDETGVIVDLGHLAQYPSLNELTDFIVAEAARQDADA